MARHRNERRTKVRGRKKGMATYKKVLIALLVVFVALIVAGCGIVFNKSLWPQLDVSKLDELQQTTIVYDREGTAIASLHGSEDRVVVSLDSIPKHVQQAFISAEDQRFYSHHGIDVKRILGALWHDIRTGGLNQGASTITQQLIKLSHLSPEKTWKRKIQEAYLAIQLERVYNKDEILEKYLNYVYFGNGYYGIEAAARGYFGKSAKDLTLDEGAMLAGVLKSTTNYAPHIQYENSIQRRNVILSLMADYGYISEEEAEQAKQARPAIREKVKSEYPHGFAVELALEETSERLGLSYEEVLGGGYHIYTTLDTALQEQCEKAYADESLFPASADDGTQCQSAMVVLDAKDGSVQALMGGRTYEVQRGLNRATDMYRQPGSTIKPILVYGPAVEQGYAPATMLDDAPADFNGYSPRNFADRYYGWVTMRTALSKSLNVPAVRILNDIGVETGKGYAQKAGISFEPQDLNLSLALGGFTKGVSPLMLAGAYTSIANGGQYHAPSILKSIAYSTGETVWERQDEPVQVFTADTAYMVADMMVSTVRTGTGGRLKELPFMVAAKTGTVGEENGGNRDIWAAAITTRHVAVAWMGFDNPDPAHSIPANLTGGTLTAGLLRQVLEGQAAPDFEKPEGVVAVELDAKTLYEEHRMVLASSLTPSEQRMTEIFQANRVPQDLTTYWSIPQPPTDLSVEPFAQSAVIRYTTPAPHIKYQLFRRVETEVPVMIDEHTGGGTVTVTDEEVLPGVRYTYYVVPVHPEIRVNGAPLNGPASQSVDFILPLDNATESPPPSPTPVQTPTPKPTKKPSAKPSPTPTLAPVGGGNKPKPTPSSTPEQATPSPEPSEPAGADDEEPERLEMAQ